MEIDPSLLKYELHDLRRRLDALEHEIRPYMPMIIEADIPQGEDEASKASKIGILGFLMDEVTELMNFNLRFSFRDLTAPEGGGAVEVGPSGLGSAIMLRFRNGKLMLNLGFLPEDGDEEIFTMDVGVPALDNVYQD